MSQNLIEKITKCLVDTFVFLETSSEEIVNEDSAIEMLEQLGADIQSLDEMSKKQLNKQILIISSEYPKNLGDIIKKMPENLGIN